MLAQGIGVWHLRLMGLGLKLSKISLQPRHPPAEKDLRNSAQSSNQKSCSTVGGLGNVWQTPLQHWSERCNGARGLGFKASCVKPHNEYITDCTGPVVGSWARCRRLSQTLPKEVVLLTKCQNLKDSGYGHRVTQHSRLFGLACDASLWLWS